MSGDAWGDARHARRSTALDGASVPMLVKEGFDETDRDAPSKGATSIKKRLSLREVETQDEVKVHAMAWVRGGFTTPC